MLGTYIGWRCNGDKIGANNKGDYPHRALLLQRVFPQPRRLSPLLKRPLERENPLVVGTVAWSG